MRCRAVSCFAVLSLSYIPDDNTINSKHAELARASVYVLEHFIQKPSFSFFSCCTGTYTATNSSTARSSMYVYIRVWMSLNREHSKAQHSTAQSPLHKAANQVRADQSTYQKKFVVRTYMLRPVCFPGRWSTLHLFASRLFAPKMLEHLLYYVCPSYQ